MFPVCNWQVLITGWGKCLAPDRQQAITSAYDGRVRCRMYVSLGLNELIR